MTVVSRAFGAGLVAGAAGSVGLAIREMAQTNNSSVGTPASTNLSLGLLVGGWGGALLSSNLKLTGASLGVALIGAGGVLANQLAD